MKSYRVLVIAIIFVVANGHFAYGANEAEVPKTNATVVVPTAAPGNDTTVAPTPTTSPPTTTTLEPSTTSTTTTTTTTAAPTTTTAAPTTSSTTTTTTTTPAPVTTTQKPDPAVPCRRFDMPSMLGGIVLTLGLLAIGFVSLKIYKSKTERNYHTL